jgi:hypothetical protein
MNFFLYIILITVIFIIYTEYSLGNIFYRINSKGKKSLNLSSGINYLIDPLKNTFLWDFKVLDVNYIFILIISIIIYFIVLYYNGENKSPEEYQKEK